MVANRGKKPRIDAAKDDEVILAAQKLLVIQQELEKINESSIAEISKIEQELLKKKKPVYRRRNEIISEIPDFWLTSFLNHPVLEDMLMKEDKEILVYLDSVNVEDFEDPRKGYCITFNFKANPFFKNKKLTKTINFLGDGAMNSTGTIINWKAGKGPADVGSNDNKGNKRPLPVERLFEWFSSTDEDTVDMVAQVIKEEIWPNPIERINALIDTDDDDEDEDEDEDDDEGDEEEEDEGGSDEDR